MALTLQQRLERIKVRQRELAYWRAREAVPVTGWTFEGAPIAIGAPWPHRDGVVHFAASAEVPAHWPIEEARLLLDVGGESLLTLSYPNRDSQSFGLDPYHREFPLKGRQFAIATETTAREPFGVPVRAPRLNRASLQWIDWPVHRLALLLQQVAETCATLGNHEVVPHLISAAEDAQRSLDWPSGTADYIARMAPSPGQQSIWELPPVIDNPAGLNQSQRQTVIEAYDALADALKGLQKRYPPEGKLALSGHAHIDLAWLWPYAETRRKMRRTFHTALSLMEQSADYRFNQSTAHYYARMEQDDPAVLDKIKARVKSGQWEVLGGMWVEPDTNMPTGESLVRQILYGQRYFEKHFGARHTVCWLPDCFGFSGALPQLLRQGGIENFFTIKVNWSETNKIPADLFWWEGLDGSRVLTHTFDNPLGGYNGMLQPDAFVPTWRNFKGKTLHDTSLLAIGYGDGGGGTTPEMIEREEQLRNFPAIPAAHWGKVADYFADAQQVALEKDLPVWSGEIYLELHRATLTTQSGVKRLHRQAERALITAETLASLAHLMGGAYPQSLEPLWRVVLKNEFHDILPGSSIREVYQDAERELDEIIAAARTAQDAAMNAIAAQMPKNASAGPGYLVVNPSLDKRYLSVTARTGEPFASWDVLEGLGATVFPELALQVASPLSVSPTHLENGKLRAEIGKDGTLTSLVLKHDGQGSREALAGAGNQLWAYPVDKPRNWDAWDVEDDYAARGEQITEVESIEVVENTPHRVGVRVVRKYRASTIMQTYRLSSNSIRLDIETELDWHDRRVFLRTLTPVAVRNREATFECAYGVVKRPTHHNTSWDQAMYEAAAHRFIDLSETGFGVALLNNAKYGHSLRGNVLGMSLLRSPIYPDPLADEGKQSFTYALMPHVGDWHEARVREEAEDLNQPLLVLPVGGLAANRTLPALRVSGGALSGLKSAEDGDGLILRIYEPAGGRQTVEVVAEGWTATPVNIMEEAQPSRDPELLMPFEVRSWRLRRT
ncbi:MAG: glycoside hydrolase family 38 C-terminal domain-containing protein [Devosia sp.]